MVSVLFVLGLVLWSSSFQQVDSKLDKDINNALAKWSKAQIGKQSTRGISPLPARQQRPEARPK